jgi:hypothetical protein
MIDLTQSAQGTQRVRRERRSRNQIRSTKSPAQIRKVRISLSDQELLPVSSTWRTRYVAPGQAEIRNKFEGIEIQNSDMQSRNFQLSTLLAQLFKVVALAYSTKEIQWTEARHEKLVSGFSPLSLMMDRMFCCSTCNLSVGLNESIHRIKVRSTPSSLYGDSSCGEIEFLVADACKLFLLTISGGSLLLHHFRLYNRPFCVKRTQRSQVEARRPGSEKAGKLYSLPASQLGMRT